MTTQTRSELESFHNFLGGQLKIASTELSPEQALAMWREQQETVASIERGLNDIESGRVKAADEVLSELGKRKQP